MEILELVRRAASILEERKGENVVVIDLGDVSVPTGYFVIVGTDNPVHAKSLVNALREGLDVKPMHSEGQGERRWIVLDYGDFVVHILDRDAREFYDIESLWSDHVISLGASPAAAE